MRVGKNFGHAVFPQQYLKVFILGKRDSTFENCQTKMLDFIYVQFRSDENYRSYKPKRKVTVFFAQPLEKGD